MAAERYLSRRIPDLRVGNNIDEIDKKLIPASIHPCSLLPLQRIAATWMSVKVPYGFLERGFIRVCVKGWGFAALLILSFFLNIP